MAMINQSVPTLSKWPFFLGDALLVGLGFYFYFHAGNAPSTWLVLACCLSVAIGAVFGVLPFTLEYKAAVKLAEGQGLTNAVSQIQNLEKVAAYIGGATAQWQTVQEAADKTNAGAKQIADRMVAEVKAFNEFIQRANEDERSALRLEVEKLRRTETDWLQVLVRMLDHVYALHKAALRSQQPSLIEQLSNFQAACRDVARRVGLTPFVAEPEDLFDGQRHQLAEGEAEPPANAIVEETLATGYTFQGRLLRPALVKLRNESSGVAPAANETPAPTQQVLGGEYSENLD